MIKLRRNKRGPFGKAATRRIVRGVFRLIALFRTPRGGDNEGLPWQVVIVLKLAAKFATKPSDLTPTILRRDYLRLTTVYHLNDTAMADVTDIDIRPDLKVRLYRPQGITTPAPALVYFHGGGGVIGDLESHDTLCRHIAGRANIVVLAVDYRLGPEHRAPAQAIDAIDAFNWARANADRLDLDPACIGAGGDSAGGLLTFVLATQALSPTLPQSKTPPGTGMPAFLWTIYPAVDRRQITSSMDKFTEGLLLTTPLIDWFEAHTWDAGRGKSDAIISPAVLPTEGLPPTFVLTVGFDPLRDEGIAMARRLKAEGVTVIHHHHPRLLHEFISMGGVVPEAREALDEAINVLAVMTGSK